MKNRKVGLFIIVILMIILISYGYINKKNNNNYTINYDNNGGSGCATKDVVFNEKYGELCIPTRDNDRFKGWFLDNKKVTSDTIHSVKHNVTLKAKWLGDYTCVRATNYHYDDCDQSAVTSGKIFCNDKVQEIGGTIIIDPGLITIPKDPGIIEPIINRPRKTTYEAGRIKYGALSASNTKLSIGEALDCDINGDGIYDAETERFYYVYSKDNYASLIYSQNTKGDLIDNEAHDSYYSTNDNKLGPENISEKLPTSAFWTNIKLDNSTSNLNINVSPYSYLYDYKAKRDNVAKLLNYDLIMEQCGLNSETNINKVLRNHKCSFLLENTSFTKTGYLNGYWMETPDVTNKTNAYYVDAKNNKFTSVKVKTNSYGARPVIEIALDKLDLEINDTHVLSYLKGKDYSGCESAAKEIKFGEPYGQLCTPTYTGNYGNAVFSGWYDQYNNLVTEKMMVIDLENHALTASFSHPPV